MIKKTMIAAAVSLAATAMQARIPNYPAIHQDGTRLFCERVATDLQHRNAKRQVLANAKHLLDDTHLWSNGVDLAFATCYVAESRDVSIQLLVNPEERIDDPITLLKASKGKVNREHDTGSRFTVERLGNYKMFVERDARGVPLSAYYAVTQQEVDEFSWMLMTHLFLAGNYATAEGKYAVFGARMPHYAGNSYDDDPGIFAFQAEPDFSAINLLYGAGRVSGGDPSSPNYGKMPGGGGACAIMGPMQWRVTPTVEGIKVDVVHDEPFVAHRPRVADGSVLTWSQSPYEGIDGRWAIASVVPLTHQLLRLLPTQVLTLMRGEIYARHGDTFANPDTQRYFDAQPWYKPTGGHIALTDIERFNYALIKQIESTR